VKKDVSGVIEKASRRNGWPMRFSFCSKDCLKVDEWMEHLEAKDAGASITSSG
jgi:hypothetical protein